MSSTLAVARRELSERSFVFITAAVLAVVPFLFTVIPGTWFPRMSVVATIGGVAAVGFSLALSIVLGSALIGRDLAEKRMSFYFSKPLSASSIWFGKLLAAIFTVVVCLALIATPMLLVAHRDWDTSWNVDIGAGAGLVVAISIALIAISHAISTMLRSRSALAILDIALAVGSIFSAVQLIRKLLTGFAVTLAVGLGIAMGAAVILAIIFGGAWPLSRGRVDRVRNHVELSKALWISVAAILALSGAYVGWVVNVTPLDLKPQIETTQSPRGPWVVMGGLTRHRADYAATFAYDLDTGHSIRLKGGRPWWSSAINAGGTHALWVELHSIHNMLGELCLQPLREGAEPVHSGLEVGASDLFVASDDGSRLAVVANDGLVTVQDVAAQKAVGSAKVALSDDLRIRRAFFIDNDTLRMYALSVTRAGVVAPAERTIDIWELNARTRSLQHTGTYHAVAPKLQMTVSRDGSRAVISRGSESGGLTVLDARTAAVIGTIPAVSMSRLMFTADNGFAAITDNNSMLTIYGPDLAVRRTIPIGQRSGTVMGAELTGGRLFIVSAGLGKHETLVIDYANGTVLRRQPSLRAHSESFADWYAFDPRHMVYEAERPWTAYDDKQSLLVWKPMTGETKVLIGG
jgi:hypothetical protein